MMSSPPMVTNDRGGSADGRVCERRFPNGVGAKTNRSFSKAREALLKRWMSNAEWPKSVAAVALAYPLANPTIAAIVERTESPGPLGSAATAFRKLS
jgi:hypothetical protein